MCEIFYNGRDYLICEEMPTLVTLPIDHLDERPLFRDPFGLQSLVEHLTSHPARISTQNHPKQVGQATGSHHMQLVVGEETHRNARCRLRPGAHGFLAGKKGRDGKTEDILALVRQNPPPQALRSPDASKASGFRT